ncbi:MAG: hypothetical protein OXR84_01675, partial [Magnetovibrio sp.]|nr:hypothetical protein [Magnetovibrio sp.]
RKTARRRGHAAEKVSLFMAGLCVVHGYQAVNGTSESSASVAIFRPNRGGLGHAGLIKIHKDIKIS